jgi:hypothetical protein
MRFYYMSTKMTMDKRLTVTSVGKDMGKLVYSYIVGENVKWCNHSGKQLDNSLKC